MTRPTAAPNSAVIYLGPSELTGEPIVVVATGLTRGSDNGKTGAMIQTYILRADVHPVIAVRTGEDAAICGSGEHACPLRPIIAAAIDRASGARDARGVKRPGATVAPVCYVQKGKGPANVYRTFTRGRYPTMAPVVVGAMARLAGRRVRIGTYGDPAAVPTRVWTELLTGQSARTGYTHQWRSASHLRGSVMASVGTAAEQREAAAAGWRTFRVRAASDPLLPGEIVCPASAEGGRRTHCADCGLCDGARPADRRASIAIIDHGPTAVRPLPMARGNRHD